MKSPILYSFRRCPYAIRARMALSYAGITIELREISLKSRPIELYKISPKGTVPVLELPDGTVIDQSIDIMKWALNISDQDGWIDKKKQVQTEIIYQNDFNFKPWLDKYKYYNRYPENTKSYYREKCSDFFKKYDDLLISNVYLLGNKLSLADIAIFPFIRQSANVDIEWFSKEYVNLATWLYQQIESGLFKSIMHKYNVWDMSDKVKIIKFM